MEPPAAGEDSWGVATAHAGARVILLRPTRGAVASSLRLVVGSSQQSRGHPPTRTFWSLEVSVPGAGGPGADRAEGLRCPAGPGGLHGAVWPFPLPQLKARSPERGCPAAPAAEPRSPQLCSGNAGRSCCGGVSLRHMDPVPFPAGGKGEGHAQPAGRGGVQLSLLRLSDS